MCVNTMCIYIYIYIERERERERETYRSIDTERVIQNGASDPKACNSARRPPKGFEGRTRFRCATADCLLTRHLHTPCPTTV